MDQNNSTLNQVTQTKFNEIEKELSEVQKDMIGVKHVLNSQGEILKEIKDVLIKQHETLEKVSTIAENQRNMQLEINELKTDYTNRKKVTDGFIHEGQTFMSKWRGGLAVAVFCFTLAQAIVGYSIRSAYDQIDHLNKENSELKREMAVLSYRLSEK